METEDLAQQNCSFQKLVVPLLLSGLGLDAAELHHCSSGIRTCLKLSKRKQPLVLSCSSALAPILCFLRWSHYHKCKETHDLDISERLCAVSSMHLYDT